MSDLDSLIFFFQSYGYFAVFGMLILCGLGLPVPEDISITAGGIIAGLGFADPYIMTAVSMAGVLIGDTTMFGIGWWAGRRAGLSGRTSKMLTPERIVKVRLWYAKYGRMLIFGARFAPGLRSPIFAVTGATAGVRYPVFLLIDGAAALISVPFWVAVGYFGAENRDIIMKAAGGSRYFLVAMISAVVIFAVVKTVIGRRKKI